MCMASAKAGWTWIAAKSGKPRPRVGIPVPVEGAEGKVLYVWFDAPIGYILLPRSSVQMIGRLGGRMTAPSWSLHREGQYCLPLYCLPSVLKRLRALYPA